MCATRPTSPPPVASEWTVSAPSEAPCWIFASTASPRAKKKVDARKGSTSESMSSHTPSLSTGGTVEASSPEDSRSSTSREARCCSEVLAQTPRPLSSATRISTTLSRLRLSRRAQSLACRLGAYEVAGRSQWLPEAEEGNGLPWRAFNGGRRRGDRRGTGTAREAELAKFRETSRTANYR